jgi:hypothetical protein
LATLVNPVSSPAELIGLDSCPLRAAELLFLLSGLGMSGLSLLIRSLISAVEYDFDAFTLSKGRAADAQASLTILSLFLLLAES